MTAIDTTPVRAIAVIEHVLATHEARDHHALATRIVAVLHARGMQVMTASDVAEYDRWRAERQQRLREVG